MARFDDPVALFNAAADAYRGGDAERFGECFDWVSLEQLRRQTLSNIRRELSRTTVDEIMQADPNIPREVAEYQLAQMQRNSDPRDRIRMEFPDIDSIDTLESMSLGAFFYAYVDAHSMRRQIQRFVEDGRAPPRMLESFRAPRLRALGSIMANDHVAWVIFQEEHGEFRPSAEWLQWYPVQEHSMAIALARAGRPQFQTCYRQPDGGWKLVADFMGFGGVNRHIVAIAEPEANAPE